MSAGEASVFPRIDPDDPLSQAARETNAHADAHGLEATLQWLGMAGAGEVAYLGEQRALRAVAASTLGAGDVDERIARSIVATPLWRDMRMLLVGCYMDGMAIGWKGHELASRAGASDA